MVIKDCLNTMKRFGNMKCRFGVAFAVGLSFVHLKAENVVFADFEGGEYPNGWIVKGDAFGKSPATGIFLKQQKVKGFKGKGFVNTFVRQDKSTGSLTSPEFTIEKRAINFLIGGGRKPGTCCINLLVDGKIVRSSTGADLEMLVEDGWDVSEFIGKRARLQILDSATGGWGHINVDQIEFSDVSKARAVVEVCHEISSKMPFVLVPVDNDVPNKDRFEVYDGNECVRFWNISYGLKKADWFASLDLSEWAGKKLSFRLVNRTESEAKKALSQLRFASAPWLPSNVYNEPKRPQIHLSPTLGWNNDPNGLSYYNGEYHVFYQHNPCGRTWQNMTWGHYVSKDLVHWKDVGDVIHPDNLGRMFSGSAVVDKNGSAGFGTNAHVIVYTAAGEPPTQCIAGSVDGRVYRKLKTNPVIGYITPYARDPKVFWHKPTGKWVMCLYVGGTERQDSKWHAFHIFNSSDLLNWQLTDVIYGDKDHKWYMGQEASDPKIGTYLYECPDLVELKIAGSSETRWVVYCATGQYGIGKFDGIKFVPEKSDVRTTFCHRLSGSNCGYYAAQTFWGDPKGRTIWMPWLKLETNDANFNQGFGIPMTLSLKKTNEGLRLAFDPVEEYQKLRDGVAVPFDRFDGELAEAFFDAKVGPDATVTFDLRGEKLIFNAAKSSLTLVSKNPKRASTSFLWRTSNGRLSMRFFIDRLGLEVLSADGLQLAPFAVFCPDMKNRSLSYRVEGTVEDVKSRVYRLKSIW